MPAAHEPEATSAILDPRVLRWAAMTLFLLFACRIAFRLFAGPLPDEAYYWLWGQHLAFSYFDHPPLQAWLQGASNALFGDSLFALRLPSLLTTIWIVGLLAWWTARVRKEMPDVPALAIVAVFFCSPMLFIYTMIVFNDYLMVALLLTAGILFSIVLGNVSQKQPLSLLPLYGAGLALGLATLTKYNAVLFGVGIAATIIFYANFRPLLRSPHLYLAALLSVLCFTPVFIWNLNHEGASFQYNLFDRIDDELTQVEKLYELGVLAALTALTLSPLLFGAVASAARKRQPTLYLRDWRALALGPMIATLVVFLVLSQILSAYFYWTITAWVMIVPLAALHIMRRWVFAALFSLGVAGAVLYTVNYAVLPLSALIGPTDHETALLYGWGEVVPAIAAVEHSGETSFLLATDYRLGAIAAFWTGDRNVEVISKRKSQFDYWFDENGHAGKNALIISNRKYPVTDRIASRFSAVRKVGNIRVTRFGYPITSYTLHIGRDYIAANAAP